MNDIVGTCSSPDSKEALAYECARTIRKLSNVRRIGKDTYDTDTKDGYLLVQEDWIAGAIEDICQRAYAIGKNVSQRGTDLSYISEKIEQIKYDISIIEERSKFAKQVDESIRFREVLKKQSKNQ